MGKEYSKIFNRTAEISPILPKICPVTNHNSNNMMLESS